MDNLASYTDGRFIEVYLNKTMVEVDLPRWISSISPQRVAAVPRLTGLANLAWAVATLGAEGQAEDLLIAIQEEVWRTNVSDILKEGMRSIG